jgi:DNA-binding CsgD family transcriptional regulator
MAIIKHYGDFYDFFFFDINSHNPYEAYLGKLNTFYNFIDLHKDNKHEFIQRLGKQLLKVDEKYQPQKMSQAVTASFNEPEPQFYELFTHGNFIRITHKEFQCLQSLAKGASTKHIANHLDLSHRTVEHRVSALKTKLHCHSTQQIIDLFWANFSDRPSPPSP